MYVTAILLAAGKGIRIKSKISKPLIRIGSRAAINYSLFAFDRHAYIKDIIVVVNSGNLEGINSEIIRYRINKVRRVVLGGRKRQDSVLSGLYAMNKKTELVLIHDAARPFVTEGIISAVIKEAKRCGAAIAGVPVKDTIKRVTRSPGHQVTSKFIVEETLDREKLWEIQTPQVFKKDIILKAYKRFVAVGTEQCSVPTSNTEMKVTDDAMLVEKMGSKVNVVLGSYNNIKITTPEDLVIAEAIAKRL